jgi:hypothetical protein
MTSLEQLNRTILLCRDYLDGGLSDDEICGSFLSLRVLCVSDRRNLSSLSGQTALFTLVSLLSRMGVQVGLAFPDVALQSPQPPLVGASVCAALLESSEKLVTGATVCCDSNFNPDLVFVFGDTKDCGRSVPAWRLSGGCWSGTLTVEGKGEARPWTTEWPIGSMVSASLAANEAFKFVMRGLPLHEQSDQVFFEPSSVCKWSFDMVPIPEGGVHLGGVDIISAGAISQAALYVLLRLPNVQMTGRIFDDDLTGASNLNRNMLTLVTDIGRKKVLVVAQRCTPALRLAAIPSRFVGEASEVEKLAQRVLIGVDDIPSRWDVQRSAPGWLAVGGTSHFSVSSSVHSPGEPCCGCLHPVDDPAGTNLVPTVSFVSFWAGLTMAVRLLREALARPYPRDRQHLWLTPLRMDQRHAAMWTPVALRRDCPVPCLASQESQPDGRPTT